MAHGLAVDLTDVGHAAPRAGQGVDGGALVRVLPVAQGGQALVADADVGGRGAPARVRGPGGARGWARATM